MAEVHKLNAASKQENVASSGSGEEAKIAGSANISEDNKESHDSSCEGKESSEKSKELPEPIRPGGGKGMMTGLPPIDINELTSMLRSPGMPSQKIMKEVADKMLLKSEESESDDGSVGSSGGVGMKGLFDCILEVSLLHPDSDNSDDDDPHENVTREIPCRFCNKIFGSTMTWKTHVLVAHPQQDPSVLNIRRLSGNENDLRDKGHPPYRRRSKTSSKSDCDSKDSKSRHSSKSDMKGCTDAHVGEENVPVSKRQGSMSRSHQKGPSTVKSEHKNQLVPDPEVKKFQPKEKSIQKRDSPVDVADTTDQAQTEGSKCTKSSVATTAGQPSHKRKAGEIPEDEDLIVVSNQSACLSIPRQDSPGKRKRNNRSTEEPLSSSSVPISSSSDSAIFKQHSKKTEAKEMSSACKRKSSDTSVSEAAKIARAAKSESSNATEKSASTPKRRSSRQR